MQQEGLETVWLGFPFVLRPEAGLERTRVQQELEARGVDTRMVWTGNVTRQPMMRGVDYRLGSDGFPNADRVMEHGLLLPSNHFMTRSDTEFARSVLDEAIRAALAGR